MKAIINSVKHIVQRSLILVTEQTIINVGIAQTVTAEPTDPKHVVVGSLIKAIFFEYWLLGESAQPCTTTWSIEKLVNSATPMTQAQGQDLDSYDNKKNILKCGQGWIGDSNSNPIPIIREWIKIPKGKQRMAQGDSWKFNISCVGEADNGLEVCGLAVYKEYQ